ncbi:putative M15 family peptidase [Proteus phage PM 116]|uniref:Putative M15 family peptidase n=1 Tax=Proteus phage PM 116 TaxID=1837877 RepID=A0A2D0VKR9_9CAUD|nr:endolysin [Proteus phage PM 116]ANU80127.1 putative M15 family peptidase [Proteus phage PM 116]
MLNNYFKRREFACKCGCGTSTVDYELLQVITDVREHFGKPIIITSGHRCFKHNANVGGARNSMHLTGKAADIKVQGVDPADVADYLETKYPDKYGIGRYAGRFTHIDVRGYKARWRG